MTSEQEDRIARLAEVWPSVRVKEGSPLVRAECGAFEQGAFIARRTLWLRADGSTEFIGNYHGSIS